MKLQQLFKMPTTHLQLRKMVDKFVENAWNHIIDECNVNKLEMKILIEQCHQFENGESHS
jgi:hypothetical protein